MSRSAFSSIKSIPVAGVLAFAFLLTALLLPGCGPPPVDDKLVDGSDCSRGQQCQSAHCWQEASEENKTCKAEAKPAG